MKPLTRYDHEIERNGEVAIGLHCYSSRMVPDDGGDWYAKDEADAVIRELGELVDSWMNSATTRAHQLNAAEKRIAELEAERDAARADAESNRVNTERYECMRDKYLSRWIEKEKIDALIDKARGVTK